MKQMAAIMVPENELKLFTDLREFFDEHDIEYKDSPPHITIIPPMVSGYKIIKSELEDIHIPKGIAFNAGFDAFGHHASIIRMKFSCAFEKKLLALRHTGNIKYDYPYAPHITIARGIPHNIRRMLLKHRWDRRIHPLQWDVDHIAILEKQSSGWELREKIALA